MSAANGRLRLSVQAKVLLVVLSVLVLLPLLTVWIVNEQTSRLVLEQARQALMTAEVVFQNSLEVRDRSLLAGYRNAVIQQSFRSAVTLNDRATMDASLRQLLGEANEEAEAMLFYRAKGELLGSARREGGPMLESFEHVATAAANEAFDGDARVANVVLQNRAFIIAAVPVSLGQGGGVAGVLMAAVRIGEKSLQELKALTRAEIVVVARGEVIASTLLDVGRPGDWLHEIVNAKDGGTPEVAPVVVGGERFQALRAVAAAPGGLQFALLSSYEKSARALADTRQTLFEVSAAGILLSALVVWLFVRRVTRPLVELRDSAEAVGRGDFSRRIERFSDDEVGDLAQEFNRMTGNLQTSRAELERAMQTVKATQSQLIQSEKLSAVGQFVAGVAHELNNPLTAVVGFAEILQNTETDSRIRGHLDRIAKSAHRCHKIVSSLLSFARQHPPERKLVDLHAIMDSVLELMTYDLRTSNVTIVKDYAPTLPLTMADPHQLEQVFVNIIGNARQAIEPVQREGRITVRTRAAGNRVSIEFEDNGPGIRPEHLARLFDPFFTTKPVGKGTGLGLSLVYGIIQEHGGKISARSELGHGATFAIDLPAATQPASVFSDLGAPALPHSAPSPAAKGRTVLVIDDEVWILDLAAELLRLEGYAVETAVGGEQALAQLGRRRFDVIISDWKMPGLNGVRLFEHLHATDPASAARVLFMTGDVVSETFQTFLREHRLGCLSKPFALGEFRAAVARMAASAG